MAMRFENPLVVAKLQRLSALVFARDLAVVDELWSDLGFILRGSARGEGAESHEALVRLFQALFARPYRISWAWEDIILDRHGDLIWVCAESQLLLSYADRTVRLPYRLTAIFQQLDQGLRWRLFSGSEPAPPPAQ